jgi:hypothetical protein
MRSGVTRIAALAVLLLAGFPAAASAASLSASAPHVIKYGKTAKVKGKLTGHLLSDSGIQVQLQVTFFPYKAAFKTVATQKTDSSGGYSFTTKPDRNARYRVTATDGSATSKEVQVFVNGIPRTKVRTKSGAALVDASFTFSPKISTNVFTGRALYWYYKPKSAKSFRKVATTKTRRLGPGKVGGSLVFALPKSTSKQTYLIKWCFQLPAGKRNVGVGDPATSFRTCQK